MSQVLQVLGAVLILAAYAAAQFRLLEQRSYRYLGLNIVGSGILAVLAAEQRQWGFLLLEGAWALLSLWSVITEALRQRRRPHGGP